MGTPSKIRVVDFETTGLAPPADVVESGTCDVVRDGPGGRTISAPRSTLHGSTKITAETRAIHHIAPSEVAGLPPFDADLFFEAAVTDGVDAFAAHHADFEAKWLPGAVPSLICTWKAAMRAWPEAPSHQNQVLRYWLEEQGLTKVDPVLAQPAHRAGPDAYATAHLLNALLDRASVEELLAWTKEPAALPRITIGKQRGAKWADVEEGFLSWMLRQADMDADLKWNAERELKRRRGSSR